MKKVLHTGFKDFDNIVNADGGKGKLISVASRPLVGKTALILDIVKNIVVKDEKEVLIFSFEMTKSQVDRLLDKKLLPLYAKDFIHIEDNGEADINFIESRISKYNNLGLVVIDYIDLIGYEDLSTIVYKLKNICKKNNIHIIFAQQLPKIVDARVDKRPRLSDLYNYRLRGANMDNLDAVFGLYRQSRFENEKEYEKTDLAELLLLKNKYGKLKKTYLTFNKRKISFKSIA